MNQSLRYLGKKIGLPFNLQFHCSRHTYGTLLLNKGVDLNVFSHLMGLSSTGVTQKAWRINKKNAPSPIRRECAKSVNC
ncbi:MAG: hypothetical protein HDS88_05755 [Bacteroidales bacterium]|nr:hypothetical protein [Bacteroidales bacterium]